MDNNNRNMFSTLTSSRLVLIVNYLPFKEALRTSILSKQWRNVWRETTNLEFHEKFFIDLEEIDKKNQRIEEDDAKKHLAIVELPFQVYQHREMVEADLDFGMELEFDILGSLLNDFLQKFYAAKVLTIIREHCTHHLNRKLQLCHSFWNSKFYVVVQVVSLGEETFSLQASLDVRDLILKTAMHSCEFYGIRFMFRSCPKLETLTFDIGPAKIFSLGTYTI
ncbi:putative F-box/LRR-repeat protein At5g54820 [Hevea brasiliensis]|uniref:putative F-box/LRR-repeat protein At5g54820 n=1 Tax=Hevea brasiliensis TaxID=3981 RepID=UPI0025FB3E9A|nr:putative F-box/LRR-repeat protein At5g54820 [Hevea brasiliensis]